MTSAMLLLKIVHVMFEGGPDEILKNKLYCNGIECDGGITETCMTCSVNGPSEKNGHFDLYLKCF